MIIFVESVPDTSPVTTLLRGGKDCLEKARFLHSGPTQKVTIILLPTAAPACPAPTVRVAAEIIASVSAPLSVLEIIAADAPDSFIITVALKQGIAIGEKISMRHAVILKDDPILFVVKKPGDGPTHGLTAAIICIVEKPLNLAVPINVLIDQLTGSLHLSRLVRPAGKSAITSDIKAGWGVFPNGLKNLQCGVRTAPGQ